MDVASRVGAWIETENYPLTLQQPLSRPVWARGLKLTHLSDGSSNAKVASRVGAWIETKCYRFTLFEILSRPVWARGLKQRIRTD